MTRAEILAATVFAVTTIAIVGCTAMAALS